MATFIHYGGRCGGGKTAAMQDGKDSPITRVNAYLASKGRQERVVKGRGYMYFRGGELDLALGSIYWMGLTPDDYQLLLNEVKQKFRSEGVTI